MLKLDGEPFKKYVEAKHFCANGRDNEILGNAIKCRKNTWIALFAKTSPFTSWNSI